MICKEINLHTDRCSNWFFSAKDKYKKDLKKKIC